MARRMSSPHRVGVLALIAAALIAGTAVAGVASGFPLTASGSSAQNLQLAQAPTANNANSANNVLNGCQQVPPADGADPEMPNFVCSYLNPISTYQSPNTSAISSTATTSSNIASTSGPTIPSGTVSCQQVGVWSGDGEYGSTAQYQCQANPIQGQVPS